MINLNLKSEIYLAKINYYQNLLNEMSHLNSENIDYVKAQRNKFKYIAKYNNLIGGAGDTRLGNGINLYNNVYKKEYGDDDVKFDDDDFKVVPVSHNVNAIPKSPSVAPQEFDFNIYIYSIGDGKKKINLKTAILNSEKKYSKFINNPTFGELLDALTRDKHIDISALNIINKNLRSDMLNFHVQDPIDVKIGLKPEVRKKLSGNAFVGISHDIIDTNYTEKTISLADKIYLSLFDNIFNSIVENGHKNMSELTKKIFDVLNYDFAVKNEKKKYNDLVEEYEKTIKNFFSKMMSSPISITDIINKKINVIYIYKELYNLLKKYMKENDDLPGFYTLFVKAVAEYTALNQGEKLKSIEIDTVKNPLDNNVLTVLQKYNSVPKYKNNEICIFVR
jgi:hypothetical protein